MTKKKYNKIIIIITILLISISASFSYARYQSSYTASISLNIREPRYTIAFKSNDASTGKTATGSMSNEIFDYGTSKNLTTNAFAIEGYTFDSWNTSADGTGTSYQDGAEISNLSTIEGSNIDLYAQWVSNGSYTVTYTGLELTGLPTNANPGQTFQVNFGTNEIHIIKILMNNTEISNYTFTNNILSVPNVNGNIEIVAVETTNVDYVFEAGNEPVSINFSGNNAITTLTGFINNGQVNGINGSDKVITNIKIDIAYNVPNGNTKIANCSLIVDGNQVGSTQQISFVKKGTSASANFTGLNINPASIIQISYAVNNANNDAVTITNETITLTFAD